MIHDYTNNPNWTENVTNWESEFEHNDRVISMDSQKRLGDETYLVSRIDLKNENEHVHQNGLFWERRLAVAFANSVD